MATVHSELESYEKLLNEEADHTLQKTSVYTAILGVSCSIGLIAMQAVGIVDHMDVPILWTMIGGIYATVVYYLTRRGLVRGFVVYVVTFGFVTLPSVVYILGYFLLPNGTATYITGPPSYLYFFLILVSGFSFNARLSTLTGVVAGAEYFLAFVLGYPYLKDTIRLTDPLMEQDLVSPAIYSFKSLMMCFSGAVVGVLGGNARKLMGRILNEEREKTSISKLFGQFVSEEVKDKIVSQKAGLVAEKRNVAILFSDIRSFTTMSEKYDPEHIVSLLNRYFDSMVDAITKNGGTVDKFIGDAVMAYFGGLYEIANPSASALKAAIAMRANLKKLNQELKNDGIDVMENGIGIHFGEVVLGALGSIDRKDFTCIGDAVNIASRLEGLTKDFNHSIVVSRDVYTSIESDLQPLCISLGKVNVKGKSSAIEIYGVAD